MRAVLFFSVALLLANLQACDMGKLAQARPDAVKAEAERQVRPFFPDAQVVIDDKNSTVLAITCVAHLGKPALQKLMPIVDQSPGAKKLRELRGHKDAVDAMNALGRDVHTYKYFELGFDKYLVRLDTDTERPSELLESSSYPEYAALFDEKCRAPQPASEKKSDAAKADAENGH